ncbi:MAG: PQQ-dependent sugar dehydrogenase [Opitutales bacterium]|nr:PQQ-dependent sugar dehydrogenase [Opitutales bacterium]
MHVPVCAALLLIFTARSGLSASVPLTPEAAGLTGDFGPVIAQPVVTSGLTEPLFVTAAPGDDTRLFILEKTGAVRIYDRTTEGLRQTPFLIISPISTDSERGLLGMTFHPEFADNGYVYVNFTNPSGATVVRRYTVSAVDPDLADPATDFDILTVPQDFPNHNAGWMDFGPDGYLYIALGDGGSSNDPNRRALDLTNLLGSMLRIDVDADGFPGDPARNYRIPENNPFADGEDGLPEIWAYGLRNPWRNSFDRETGDLWIADVGQSSREEINFQPADSPGGENYGWRAYEGTRFTGLEPEIPADERVDPFFEYDFSDGRKSITGGYVYRGEAMPHLRGLYFFADYVDGFVRSFCPAEGGPEADSLVDWTSALGGIPSPASFGEDADGELYLVSLAGSVHRITQPGRYLWRNRNFSAAELADPAVSGWAAVPAGGGVANLLRYLFGFDAQEDARPLPVHIGVEPADGGTQTIVSMERSPEADDVDAWFEATSTPGDPASWTTDGLEVLVDSAEVLRVRDTHTGVGPRFFRLHARTEDGGNAQAPTVPVH